MRRLGLSVLATILALVPVRTAAQSRQLVGVVLDDAGQPVAGARVSVLNTFLSSTTNATGAFSLTIDRSGGLIVRAARLGFMPAELSVNVVHAGDSVLSPLVFRLERAPARLLGVMVPGERSVPLGLTATRATIRQLPPLGEPDVLRALPFLPGISQPNDMLGRIHLAGAAGDETSYTLDGHPMQSPLHLSGIVGGFNIAAIDRVEVLTHHVPAVVDSRLGGTVALSSRERSAERDGEAIATLLASSVTMHEPRLPGGSELLVSGRLTYMDRLHRRVYGSARADGDPIPSYGDALVRAGVPIGSTSWHAEGIGYLSRDWTGIKSAHAARARTFTESMAGMTVGSSTARARTTFRASQNLAISRIGDQAHPGAPFLDVEQRLVSAAATHERQLGRAVRASVSASIDRRDHGHAWTYSAVEVVGLPDRLQSKTEQSLYALGVNFSTTVPEALAYEVGARVSSVGRSAHLAPRLQASWTLGPGAVEMAFDRRYQFDSQFGEPEDGGVPSPVFLLDEPRRVDALAISYELSPSLGRGRSLALNATLFGRLFAGRTVPTESTDMVKFGRTRARSSGAAIGATYSTDRGAMIQGAYTYSLTTQLTASGDQPAGWDAPHSLAMLVGMPAGGGWTVSAAFQLRSGLPVTPVLTQVLVPSPAYPGLLTRRLIMGEENSARLPGYHRLDLALRRSWSPGPFEVDLSLQAVNVLATENVRAYDWYQYLQAREFGGRPRAARSGVPFVPSIGVQVRW